MADISTIYAGLHLQSPIIVSSSGLTNSLSKLKTYEQAGAGAVVLKSIFEEQMESEASFMSQESDYPEAMDYLRHYITSNALDKHIDLIREARSSLSIPVIVSINCYHSDTWLDYARQLEEAGASALELNVMRIDTDLKDEYGTPEKALARMVLELKRAIKIPVTIKLSKYYTNICHLSNDLSLSGADGVVLFNRSFMPQIDINKEEIIGGETFSSPTDLSDTLRYVALVRGTTPDLSIGLSTGVRDGADVVRSILSGADGVQVCTAVYKDGDQMIRDANAFLKQWMDEKGYRTIKEFKSRLSAHRVDHANLFMRSQFMKYFASTDPTPTNAMDSQRNHPDLPY